MKATSKPQGAESSAATLAYTRAVFKKYYYLTKPGIIRGNLFTAGAGFLLAAQGQILPWQLLAMLSGLALVIAAGCVSNNYMDRSLDIKMARTARRALVMGTITDQRALVFAGVLGITGLLILLLGAGVLAAALAAIGYIAYVFVYGYGKRTTTYGTIIGSISGAIPPLVGYAAAAGRLDLAAWLLFAVLVTWQMPHFYAIAIYRLNDYRAAGLPVLPAVRGFARTKAEMILFSAGFVTACASLAFFGFVSAWCGVAMVTIGSLWLVQNILGLKLRTEDSTIHWARKVFVSSLLVLTLSSVAISIDSFI